MPIYFIYNKFIFARQTGIALLMVIFSLILVSSITEAAEKNTPTESTPIPSTPISTQDQTPKTTAKAKPAQSITTGSKTPQTRAPKPGFKPSEKISEDLSVPFPVDI